jgi:predicted transcriptional regulator
VAEQVFILVQVIMAVQVVVLAMEQLQVETELLGKDLMEAQQVEPLIHILLVLVVEELVQQVDLYLLAMSAVLAAMEFNQTSMVLLLTELEAGLEAMDLERLTADLAAEVLLL